jgi:hypothetical protein
MSWNVHSGCVADTFFVVTEIVKPMCIGGEGEQLVSRSWVWLYEYDILNQWNI